EPKPELKAYVDDLVGPWRAWSNDIDAVRHAPPELFEDLGARGLFRTRWQHGSAGLPIGLECARQFGEFSIGLGLAISIHMEVFLHTLTTLGRSPYHLAVQGSAMDGQA